MNEDSVRIVFNAGIWHIAACVVLAAVSVVLYSRTWPPVSRSRRSLLASLRSFSFILLILFIVNPACVTTKVYSRKPVVPILVDVSRSMLTRDCGDMTRMEAAWESAGIIAAGFKDAQTRVVPFASGIGIASETGGEMPQADGDGTDIHSAVRAVIKQFQSENLQALVVLSDGRVTSGMTGNAGYSHVPVYTVGFGDTTEGADLAVEEVYGEGTSYKGVAHPIEAIIRIEGEIPAPATVRLLEDRAVLDSAGIDPAGSGGEIKVSLEYVPRSEGEHLLDISVSTFEGEKTSLNNSMQVRLKVLKDKLRILYLDQYADWNMTFFRNIARRSNRLEIDQVIWSPSGGYRLVQGRDAWSFPADPSALQHYDIVVVGDYDGAAVRSHAAGVMEGYLRSGGSILFLGSERSPLVDEAAARSMEIFLPVAVRAAPAITGGEYYANWSGSAGSASLASALSASPLIDAVPPIPAVITGFEEKPGSETIMILKDRERTFPMMALQRYGDGFSAVVLGFPIWRWKLAGEKGDEFYTSLVTGLIEYMSEGFDASEVGVHTGRTVYRAGEPVTVTASFGPGFDAARVMGEITSGRGAPENFIRKFGFSQDRGYPDIFRTRLEPLQPGDYSITVTGEGPSGETVSGAASLRVETVSVEHIRTSRDRRFLQRLAEDSGGRCLEADEAGMIPGLVAPRSDTAENVRTRSVRGEILLFLGIILALSAEWILRKIWGLV